MSDFPIFTSHIIVSPAYLITRETIPVIFRAYRDENTRCDINFRILKIALQLLSNINKFERRKVCEILATELSETARSNYTNDRVPRP